MSDPPDGQKSRVEIGAYLTDDVVVPPDAVAQRRPDRNRMRRCKIEELNERDVGEKKVVDGPQFRTRDDGEEEDPVASHAEHAEKNVDNSDSVSIGGRPMGNSRVRHLCRRKVRRRHLLR